MTAELANRLASALGPDSVFSATEDVIMYEYDYGLDRRMPDLVALPRGTAAHVSEDDAIDLLAEMREGLSLLSLVGAELDLADRIGRPVGIVLVSGLKGADGERVKASARPL